MAQRSHSFSSDDVSVVHQEPSWFKRGVAESMHITLEDPSLNQDRGRHTLPAIYGELLQSRELPLTAESRDNATSSVPSC